MITGAKNFTGTPSEQVGWQALEESASRVASPGISPAAEGQPLASPGSATSDSDKEGRRVSAIGEVIHVDEPGHRRSVMFSDTESVAEEEERPYTAPILADDEVAKDPSGLAHPPAVEPRGFELEEPTSRPTSRPASLYKESSFELRHTPLEDVEEYEPLFNDDEKAEAKKPAKEDRPKSSHKQRFPSADIWEDAPSSAYYTAEVSTPELFDEQERPSPAVVPPPREGETPAQAFARHQEELAEQETRQRGPQGVNPPRNTQKPLWAQHQKHVTGEAPASRPTVNQRFPSRDVWEDAPDSLQLETTVSTPQRDDEAASPSPASPLPSTKPEIPDRPQSKSPAENNKKPTIPERPKPRQPSADDKDKPAVPGRPKPQIPARPTKAGPAGALSLAEATTATAPPPPRQKPAVPARPAMGSKIAALQAGFMSDLNRRLQLGPQQPPVRKEESPEAGEEKKVEEEKEKVPLSDARKGRARGPQRRAPAKAVAAKAAAAAEVTAAPKEEKVVFGFVGAVRVWEIDPEDGEGRVCAGGVGGVGEGEKNGVETEKKGVEKEKEEKQKKEKKENVVEKEEKEKEGQNESGKGVGEAVGAAASTAAGVVVGAVTSAVAAATAGGKEKANEKEEEVKDEPKSEGQLEAGPEPEPEEEADTESKPQAQAENEANPEADSDSSEPQKEDEEEEQAETETKSLATNMAGETLVQEEVQKNEEREEVEPVKVVEN